MTSDRFNHIIREKIDSLNNTVPPEVKWDPEKSWAKLEQKLKPQSSRISDQGDIKTYSHYYAAASIAFLLTFSWIANQQDWKKSWNGEFYNTSANVNNRQETSLLKMKFSARILEFSEPDIFNHRVKLKPTLNLNRDTRFVSLMKRSTTCPRAKRACLRYVDRRVASISPTRGKATT